MERPTSWVQASNQEGAQINAAETEGGLLSSLPSKEPIKNKIPNPKLNFIFAGKALEIYFDAVKNVEVAIDRKINTELIEMKEIAYGRYIGKYKVLKST